MYKTLKKILLFTSFSFFSFIILIAINQLHQLYIITSNIHPSFAKILIAILSIIFLLIFLIPIIGFFSLKEPLKVPNKEDELAYRLYLEKVKKRLNKNKFLIRSQFFFDEKLSLEEQINKAIELLKNESDKIIKDSANTVFISTAISQNGILDAFFVLTNLSKMIWQISHIYNQRPHSKEIVILYVNIVATVLMARELEDLILLDEQLEPILSSLLGGALSSIVPGATAITNIIISSIIQGSANSFLTLRVGAMARRYSEPIGSKDKKIIKKSSTLEACSLLGDIIQSNSMTILKSFARASKKATVDKAIENIKMGANKTGVFVKDIFKK